MSGIEFSTCDGEVRRRILGFVADPANNTLTRETHPPADERRSMVDVLRTSVNTSFACYTRGPEGAFSNVAENLQMWLRSMNLRLRIAPVDVPATSGVRAALRSWLVSDTSLAGASRRFEGILESFFRALGLHAELEQTTIPLQTLSGVLGASMVSHAFASSPQPRPWLRSWAPVVRGPLWALSAFAIARSTCMYEIWSRYMTDEDGDHLCVSPSLSFRRFGDSLLALRRAVPSGLGWLVETPDTLYAVPRPLVCLDEGKLLHAEESPAVVWPDGITEYWYRGVQVTSRVIRNPHSLSLRRILEERNLELRRVLIERVGADRFISGLDARVIHFDKDTSGSRSLLSIDVGKNEPVVLAQVLCPSTGRSYLLRVPPNTRTCKEAVAWTFGMEASAYAPLAES